ncbi:MAG: glycosyl hydrolase family 18 protein [Terriglobales bacterium]
MVLFSHEDMLPLPLRTFASFLLLVLGLQATALAKSKAVFYYVPVEDAWTSFAAHAEQIHIIAPQVFILDEKGTIHGAVEDRVRSLAKQHKIQIMPLLANEKPEAAHNVLTNQNLRQQVIADVLRLCEESGCSGLQVDIEGVLLEDTKNFTEFIRLASKAFHHRHLQLSVAIPTPLIQTTAGITYAEMFNGYAVNPEPFELREIAHLADFISLMTYGEYGVGTPPGPVAGYDWVEQSLRYALQFVPAKKLSMGLGFWAYRWCGQKVTYSGYAEVQTLAAQAGASAQWNEPHRAPWFEFDQDGCHGVAWFENQRSLQDKLKLVRQYRLHGFSAWRLGQEDPAFWQQTP